MHPATEDTRLAALTAILKVLSRWAPHARHDVVGACSPISLDLSLLGVKSKRAPLSPDDVNTFIERSKENIKNTVGELNRVILLQKQDRQVPISVCEMMEKMARSTRTAFAMVDWTPPADPATLGVDSEYDLTMAIWAALMALFDRHGAAMHLRMEARQLGGQEGQQRLLGFYVSPATGDSTAGNPRPSAPGEQISFDEARYLAEHLGFAFAENRGGIELIRPATKLASAGG